MKQYYVYVMTNPSHSTLYTGMSNDLKRRVSEHKEKKGSGFASKYNVRKLVYFERFDSAEGAIKREKQIKAGPRRKKVELIDNFNKEWIDLYDMI